jgi:hypothetical protein
MTRKTHVFLTDAEYEAAFGPQAAEATRMLSQHATTVCRDCGGECCRRIKCEFHSDRFSTCPIFEYRPAKCRLYFCEKILENEALSERERHILNQPARELSDALKRGWGIGIFIEPPVRVGDKSWLTGLGIEVQVTEIIDSLETGTLGADSARDGFLYIVRRCRRGT